MSLLITPTDLDILVVTFFTWSLKVRFSSTVMPRNLTVETFVRIESRILMSIAFLWLEIIIYKVLQTLTESLLALSQLSTSTSTLFTVAWTLLNVTVRCKNCYIFIKMNKTNLIWGSIHVIDIQKEVLGPTPILVEHPMKWSTLRSFSFWLRHIFSCYSNNTASAWHLWLHYAGAYSSMCYY